jgi:hypothetical protein
VVNVSIDIRPRERVRAVGIGETGHRILQVFVTSMTIWSGTRKESKGEKATDNRRDGPKQTTSL